MKKLLVSLILAVTFFGFIFLYSCNKKSDQCSATSSNVTAPQNEIDSVKKYLDANSITATLHSNGFYYTILTPGTGATIANLCSEVTVTYVGKLKDGTIFDQTTGGQTASFQLQQVILGWQKGLPLIAKGGSIRLYIPPTLGYGNADVKNNGVVVIPANSILIFDIQLVDVK